MCHMTHFSQVKIFDELYSLMNQSFFHSLTYDRDSGHKSFLEDVFENESRLPGGSWGPSSVPWTDVVGILSTFFHPRSFEILFNVYIIQTSPLSLSLSRA